jgi:two-component system cell cycle sensor histidine kinase/response regulator CckA
MTGVTILLVEDEPAIRRLMMAALELAGYHVLEARNGSEALSLIDEGGLAVDLLVTDMKMPYVGGQELIERLRGRRRILKVLAISGYPMSAPPDVVFLAKPFDRRGLLRAVRQALEGEV